MSTLKRNRNFYIIRHIFSIIRNMKFLSNLSNFVFANAMKGVRALIERYLPTQKRNVARRKRRSLAR